MQGQELKQKILRLKRQKQAVILAHNYQIPAIQEIADYLGDSLELSRISKSLEARTLIFCGVRFMAETAKILSPQKRVLTPVLDAGCPLADKISPRQLLELKKANPGAWVVSYVNSCAEVKALSDICCTSSNAVNVVKNVPVKKIIFVPDKNLGWWVQKNVPDKELIIWPGFCEAHEEFSLEELEETKRKYPDAKILVHPECRKEILMNADFVLSTSGMTKIAKEASAKKFIIGTEEGMIYRLKRENPDKEFFSIGGMKICHDMKKITLDDLYNSLDRGVYEISLDKEVIAKASQAIERMLKYS